MAANENLHVHSGKRSNNKVWIREDDSLDIRDTARGPLKTREKGEVNGNGYMCGPLLLISKIKIGNIQWVENEGLSNVCFEYSRYGHVKDVSYSD
ncbi:hypothetical protein Goari_012291 [Gossypium aridum]|uniref:Uncharacterized protein n=1 Tax=Gossypium aridum TaxID=34290 RepID=A0A7J8WZZ4_GOSAI|nr:hypothetical protein [Gossypium aridum]